MTPAPATAPDYSAIKQKQQATWASGDYAIIGTTLQIVGEQLCEAVDVKSGEIVLDVASGTGSVALAAARRYCDVTATDYVVALLERGKQRANAEHLEISFREADAEELPFDDQSFHVALSSFGVMFTPNQEKSASELMRVTKEGGRIGLANWTPEGFIGQLFELIGRHVAAPAGIKSPALWGTESRLAELFPGCAIQADRRIFNFRYRSAEHWFEIFRNFYGPLNRAFASIDVEKQPVFQAEILELLNSFNRAGEDALVIPGEYLEVVIRKPSA